MKTRIIVAVIFVPLIFVVLFLLPVIVTATCISAIAAIAAVELLRAVGPPAAKRVYVYAAVSAAIIPMSAVLGILDEICYAVLFLLLAVVFVDAVFTYKTKKEITLYQVAGVLFGGAVFPLFLSAIVSLRLYESGKFYVLIPFIIAFITDAGAYFTGVFFGKHHAFPQVSPKKTVEGCIGGFVVGVASMAVYGVVLHYAADLTVNILPLALYGLAGGIATELGDLVFSLIKRIFGVKDYGRLLPGHGGMLDRFDSMIFAAPVVYMLSSLLPAF